RAPGAIPALFAVHRVIAAAHGGDAVDGQLGEVVHGRVWRDVTPVDEGVDPGLLGRKSQQRLEMVDVRMDAAARDDAEQMYGLASLEGAAQRIVRAQLPALDRPAHAR